MSQPADPGSGLERVQGANPSSSHFLVAENDLKYQKILQFTVLQKRQKLHFQYNMSFFSWSWEISAGLRKNMRDLHISPVAGV